MKLTGTRRRNVTSTSAGAVSYSTTRLTVEVGPYMARFRERYERAVPPFPAGQVEEPHRDDPWNLAAWGETE
jgi:hypothetical protein